MAKYLDLVRGLFKNFDEWSIEKIPREPNDEVDSLSKIASSASKANVRFVFIVPPQVMVLQTRSNDPS